jgi:hypothetical protein
MRRAALVLAQLLLACSVDPLSAQTTSFRVRVLDASGVPLPGATVTLTARRSWCRSRPVLTDRAGARVPHPATGERLRSTSPSPACAQRGTALRIRGGLRLEVRFGPRDPRRVDVWPRCSTLDLDTATGSSRFSDTFIADMPVRSLLPERSPSRSLSPASLGFRRGRQPERARRALAGLQGAGERREQRRSPTGEWLSS